MKQILITLLILTRMVGAGQNGLNNVINTLGVGMSDLMGMVKKMNLRTLYKKCTDRINDWMMFLLISAIIGILKAINKEIDRLDEEQRQIREKG